MTDPGSNVKQSRKNNRPFQPVLAGFLFVLIFLSACSYSLKNHTLGSHHDQNRLQRHSDILKDYRIPDPGDIKVDWQYLVESNQEIPWKARVDLNGDGRTDFAYLLPRRKSQNEFGLWVLLSDDETYDTYRLLGLEEPVSCCGIYTRSAGNYGVLTDRNDDGRIDDEKTELELTQPAVEFVYFEASSRMYYWDPRSEEFSVAWTSD